MKQNLFRWLEVKGLLMRKNRKVAMKANRRWKRHWGKFSIVNFDSTVTSCLEGKESFAPSFRSASK